MVTASRRRDAARSGLPAEPTFGAPSRGTWPLLSLIVVALLVAVAARFSYLGQAFTNDPGLFVAMGKSVVEGRQLYVDIWDTKPPGITLLTAPLYAVLGNRWWAWIAAQVAMMLAAVAMLAGAAARAVPPGVDPRPARRATWAVGLALFNAHWLLISGFQLETAMAACAAAGAAAVLAALRAPSTRVAAALAFAAGVAGGAAATLKPTSLAVIGAACIVLLDLARRRGARHALRLIAAMVAGVAAAALANAAWYSYLGVWPYLAGVFREIRLYGSGTPWSQIVRPKTFALLAALLWPAAALFAGGTRSERRPAPPPDASATAFDFGRAAWTFALAWLALEIVGTVLQKRGYAYHFLPIAAPATLLAGLVAALRPPTRVAPLAVAAGIVPILAASLVSSAKPWRDYVARGGYAGKPVIDYVVRHTLPTDPIFGDPVGELSVLADRPAGARVGQLISFVNHDGAPRYFCDLVIDDLRSRRCEIIVLPIPSVLRERIATWETQPVLAAHRERVAAYREAWARLIAHVHANYVLERANLDGREIWRLKATQSATSRPTQ